MATLARGGRLNVFGFVLRLAGMVPFLFIGGRIYGPASLGRFAYAVLTVEFAAQIAALGLRRGLAQLLANAKKPQACIVADALLVAAVGSVIGMAILILFPKAMYPTTPVGGLDRLLAITVLSISWTDIALAALAYHHDVGSTVRARSIVQPWVISIAAFALSFVPIMVSRGDGLIIAYVLSMVAALVAALIPLLRCYGLPHGWKPDLGLAWITAAQLGIALALGIPGRAVMGLVGSSFTGGTAMVSFLLAAEVIAAAAVVSEAALIYVARKRNMAISLVMLALEAGLAAALILIMRREGFPPAWQATGPAIALCVALAFASITKSWLLKRQLGASVSGWRWDLAWATSAGVIVGAAVRYFLPQTLQLIIGVPAIMIAFFAVLWVEGFGPEDRELFRLGKHQVRELREAEEAAEAGDQRMTDVV